MSQRTPKFDSLPQAVQDAINSWPSVPSGGHADEQDRAARLAVIRRIAAAWGGACLSERYWPIKSKHKLKFRCADGHEWESSVRLLLYGSFCPACANLRNTLPAILQEVKAWGLSCLSSEYVNSRTPMRWRCEQGHEWSSTFGNIRQRRGCPVCSRALRYYTLEDMQRLAQENGGRCLSEQYRNVRSKLRWECRHGHIWQGDARSVLVSGWCPECRQLARKPKTYAARKVSLPQQVRAAIADWRTIILSSKPSAEQKQARLEILRRIARGWGGECLSEQYLNSHRKYKFRCAKGHEWELSAISLLYGSFCPYCSNHRVRLEDIREESKARGFTCLSNEYLNAKTPLRWRCQQGHEWLAALDNIRYGKGCPHCYRERTYYTLDDMRALAQERGGWCLSEQYRNVDHRLTWQCHRLHVWQTPPASILSGSWCPQCAILARIHKAGSKARRKYMGS